MEVTTKQDEKQYWLQNDEPYRFITGKVFSDACIAFHVAQRTRDDPGTPSTSKSYPANKHGNFTYEKLICLHLQIDPRIDIFDAFDELLLMKQGGQELYVGPVGQHFCQLIEYFLEIEGIRSVTGITKPPGFWKLPSAKQETSIGVDFTEIYRDSVLYSRFVPMETASIVLAESPIHCSQISLHYFPRIGIWENVLGSRYQEENSTRYLRCHGIYVCCSSLPWCTRCLVSASNGGC